MFHKICKTKGESFPFFNIEKLDNDLFAIIIALAGFSIEELSIVLNENVLVISGYKNEDKGVYIYKGIAMRSFSKSFELERGVEIKHASFKNGLLKIILSEPNKNSITQISIQNLNT